jgi:hypothetical protein
MAAGPDGVFFHVADNLGKWNENMGKALRKQWLVASINYERTTILRES